MNRPIKAMKRPLTMECLQYDGQNMDAVAAFVGAKNLYEGLLWVNRSVEWINLVPGMWVMKEPDDSGFYPCAEDIFASTYIRIEE